jgi:hypothetical protein
MDKILHDTHGTPVAFIANDGERTICLWDGHPVAYIDELLNCYGWNGQYMGWIEDGCLFDPKGQSVGYLKYQPSPMPSLESALGFLPPEQPKHTKCPAPSRPEKRRLASRQTLVAFLKAGAVDLQKG